MVSRCLKISVILLMSHQNRLSVTFANRSKAAISLN